MEGRQSKLLAILAGLLAAMIALITLLDPPTEPDEEGMVDRQELSATEATRLTLVTADGTTTAEHGDEGWWIVDPIQARGDDRAIEGLIGAFDRLKTSEPFEGIDPANFGLDAPVARLSVTDAQGLEHTLAVGAPSPVGSKTYVAIDGGGVRAAAGAVADSVALGLGALRDRKVYSFAASAVTGLRWESEGEGWALSRSGDGWRLADGRRASASRVEGLLAGLGALELDGFVEDSALGPVTGTLVIETADGEPARIQAGREDADGVIIRTPSGAVGILAGLELLRPYVSELLESRLLPVDPQAVTALDLRLDGAEARYVTDGDGAWRRDGGADADTVVAGDLTQLITIGTADRAAVGERGAATGALTVELGEAQLTVSLGETTDRGRLGWEQQGPAFVVPSQTVEQIEALVGG